MVAALLVLAHVVVSFWITSFVWLVTRFLPLLAEWLLAPVWRRLVLDGDDVE